MRAEDLNIYEDKDQDRIMAKRKADRETMALLAPYRHKKWITHLIAPPGSAGDDIGVSVVLQKSIGPDPNHPNINILLNRIWITNYPYAALEYDVIDKNDHQYRGNIENYYQEIRNTQHSFLKSPQMRDFIKESLYNTGLFDDQDLSEIFILGVTSHSINVSLPGMKTALRDIAAKYSKIYEYLLTYDVYYDALEIALKRLKRHQQV